MLAILATDLDLGLGNKPTKECPTGIPWYSKLDLKIYHQIASKRQKWCSKSTYLTLPNSAQCSGRFKLLTSKPKTPWEHTFEDCLSLPPVARDNRHVLIGGLKAYCALIKPACEVTIHTTIHEHHNCYFKLPPALLYQYQNVMRVFDFPGAQSQPAISVDIYFNDGKYVPQDFIQFLRKL